MPVMKTLRNKDTMKWVLWAVAIVIIIMFGFFGSANYLDFGNSVRPTSAGKLYGKPVSFEDFNRTKTETSLQLLMQYGDAFFKMQQFLNINGQTWDRIVLLNEAKNRNLQVSDKEVVAYIQDIPFFKRNEQFDSLLYNDILRESFRIQPRTFEEAIRNTLKLKKLFDQETAGILVTDDELRDEFQRQNEKVQVSYILFSPNADQVKKEFSDEEAKKYYETHLNDFLTPPSINVRYFEFGHENEAPEEAVKLMSDEADSAFYELSQNKDFEAVAKKLNLAIKETGFLDATRPGETSKQQWPFKFLRRIFQLQDKEISEPIQTNKGFFITQVKERRDPRIPEFEEAKDKVLQALQVQEAKRLVKEQADNYSNLIAGKAVKNREQFVEVAKGHDLEIHQTPAFARGQYLEKIGLSKDFQEAAFKLGENDKISKVIETDAGYCILHLDSVLPIDQSEFEEKREELSQTILGQRRTDRFNEFLNTLRLQANLEDYISELEKKSRY